MKICMEHWNQIRKGVEDYGMSSLVKDGETAIEGFAKEVNGEATTTDPEYFDPLAQVNYYVWGAGLQNMGLAAMNVDETPGAENDGHVCPLCQARKSYDHHAGKPDGKCGNPECKIQVMPGEKPWDEEMIFDRCLTPMRAYCIKKGLIPDVQ